MAEDHKPLEIWHLIPHAGVKWLSYIDSFLAHISACHFLLGHKEKEGEKTEKIWPTPSPTCFSLYAFSSIMERPACVRNIELYPSNHCHGMHYAPQPQEPCNIYYCKSKVNCHPPHLIGALPSFFALLSNTQLRWPWSFLTQSTFRMVLMDLVKWV